MSPTYLTAVAMLIVGLLANHGIQISMDDLTVTLRTIVEVGGPLLVMVRQLMTGRSTVFGSRPISFGSRHQA